MQYIFNPDHDLALAANTKYYTSPLSARKFAGDIAALPAWYANKEASIVTKMPLVEHFFALGGSGKAVDEPIKTDNVEPWGWNGVLKAQLESAGVVAEALPSDDTIYNICMLQHRRTAAKLAQQLAQLSSLFPLPAVECANIDEVIAYAGGGDVLFKAPLSGSGRGLIWVDSPISPQQLSRCRKLIDNHGAVMGEGRCKVVQDFALEYEKVGDRVQFLGYSVFDTQNGVYQSSVLASEEERKQMITQYIDVSLLDDVQMAVAQFLSVNTLDYQGVIGVDMFVFNNGDGYRLNPAVEINFRRTMGYVALMISNRFLVQGCRGRFYIDHFKSNAMLVADHQQRQTELPLTIVNQKIVSGYLSLCDVGVDTTYRARVEVNRL